ncbi:MAG: HAMP domain-containing sensor histidine kinase [Myxococcota bacterium]
MSAAPGMTEAAASVVRRGVGIPTSPRPAEARVALVGAAFLRARPLIVAPIALAQVLLLGAAAVEAPQRATLALALGATLLFFVVEAVVVRRRPVTRAWLFVSLAITAAALSVGALLSGGVASPVLPILLAPLVIALAAFGRRPGTLLLLLGVALAVALLAALPRDWPWPPPAEPWLGWMRVATFVGAAALAWTGVAGLTDAYADAALALERMRLASLEEAATRLRATEQVGARVAHEMKNPLAAMKALVQVERAARPEGDRGQLRLGVVLSEIDRLVAVVHDHLTFVRPVAELAPEPLDLAALVADVGALLEARAAERGVTLEVAAREVRLVADPARVREAILNLADNAILSTPPGGRVTLTARALARGGARVDVEDTGPGLPDPIRAAGGDAFVTTRAGGTGLGLVITRSIAERHGGRLELAERPGGGARASLLLPPEPGLPLVEEP